MTPGDRAADRAADRGADRAADNTPHGQAGETAGQAADKAAAKTPRLNSGEKLRPKRITDHLIAEVASRLIDRDRVLIRLLDRYQVLTTGQVAALLFGSYDRAGDRLLQLYRLRVVNRSRPPDPRVRRPPFHYVLDGAGAAMLGADQGRDPLQAVREQRTWAAAAMLRGQRLRHTVGTNGVFIALASHARTASDTRLAAWWSERDCRHWCGEIVRPDGLGRWYEQGQETEFLLEYDRGTEAAARIAAKLDGYRELERERGHSTWLLIAVPNLRREEHVRRTLTEERDLPIATATLDTASQPHAALWRPLHGEGPRLRLAQLEAFPKPAGAVRRAAQGGARAWRFDQREPKEVIHEYPPSLGTAT